MPAQVFYSVFALVTQRCVDGMEQHMIQQFELAVRAMPQGVETWVWLNDFFGEGLARPAGQSPGAQAQGLMCGLILACTPIQYPEPSTMNSVPWAQSRIPVLNLAQSRTLNPAFFRPACTPGFGLADLNPKLALRFLELTAAHYPERLGQLVILDAPGILGPLCERVGGGGGRRGGHCVRGREGGVGGGL